MKKFVFTLKTVYEYKQTVEKMQKADLSKAEALLRELRDEERRLDEAFERNKQSLERALESNTDVVEALERHDAYFRYLRDAIVELREKIAKAEEARDKCRELLIVTMKELKAYEKLKEAQYARYLKELAAEEEKSISDIVSFNYISEEEV